LPRIAERSECFCRDGLESFSAFALIHLASSLRDPPGAASALYLRREFDILTCLKVL
jgi:hypothetical protein